MDSQLHVPNCLNTYMHCHIKDGDTRGISPSISEEEAEPPKIYFNDILTTIIYSNRTVVENEFLNMSCITITVPFARYLYMPLIVIYMHV